MSFKHILLEQKENISLLTIDHPPANAWNLAAMEELKERLDHLENDRQTRVLILTGVGEKCFSTGFDVTDAANAPRISSLGRELWRRVDRFPKPTIAVLNGHALGGGLEAGGPFSQAYYCRPERSRPRRRAGAGPGLPFPNHGG